MIKYVNPAKIEILEKPRYTQDTILIKWAMPDAGLSGNIILNRHTLELIDDGDSSAEFCEAVIEKSEIRK